MSSAETDPTKPHVALAIGALHDVSGGAERVLVDVANGLFRRGYQVSVITHQDKNGPTFYPLDYGIERVDGRRRHSRRKKAPPLVALRSASTRRPLVAIGTWVATYIPRVWRSRRMLRVVQPDVVIGFMPSTFPYMTMAARTAGVPSVASIHNVPDRELGGDPTRWDQNMVDIKVRRKSLEWATGITVLLPSFVDDLDAGLRDKTSVVPNMIPPYRGAPALVGDDDENTILAVGRLAYAKDHETLVRAWAELEPKYPNWNVRIIGRGPLRRELHRLINKLELERIVIDPPTNEIEEAYTSSKILAMPSVHEGFGLVTAEALACGLPVVGFSDCEGTNEIVLHEENGLLVEPGDDRAIPFAAGLERLITDESLRIRLARQGPASIGRFDPDTVIDQWEQVIQHAVGGAR